MNNEPKKAIIINKIFYNLYELEEFKTYVNDTCKQLLKIYNKLGGLDNDILSPEEMCDIFTFVDMLENCEVLEVNK